MTEGEDTGRVLSRGTDLGPGSTTMKCTCIHLLLLVAVSAHAAKPARIDVKAELLINGKVVTRPRIVALPGEPAELRI